MESALLKATFVVPGYPAPYVYSLVHGGSFIAAVASDDSLRWFDPRTLTPLTDKPLVHKGVSCLRRYDEEGNVISTAGKDGRVRLWDIRSSNIVLDIAAPILSLASSVGSHTLAFGTELTNHQAVVSIWDPRNTRNARVEYADSHNDDVTEVQLHPTRPSLLLSGSTDGLVHLYDTTITEEDDALLQVMNHGSSIHHAGFLSDEDVFALSHDEVLSIYQVANPDEEVEEPLPENFGDLRTRLGCDYVADVQTDEAGGAIIAAGVHNSGIRLNALSRDTVWTLKETADVFLAGGHGEEVVRSLLNDHKSGVIYSAGEDGCIKAWSTRGDAKFAAEVNPVKRKGRREKEGKSARYKPY